MRTSVTSPSDRTPSPVSSHELISTTRGGVESTPDWTIEKSSPRTKNGWPTVPSVSTTSNEVKPAVSMKPKNLWL